MQLIATYSDCSSDNGQFPGYIEFLENQYNNGTIHLESKYLMDKEILKYNELKDKLKLKGNSKV